jgi:hypothetical protein
MPGAVVLGKKVNHLTLTGGTGAYKGVAGTLTATSHRKARPASAFHFT